MTNEDDNTNQNGCKINFIIFILTIIVYVNVNTLALGQQGCNHHAEFDYIKYSFIGTIVSMVSLFILILSVLCDNTSRCIQFICSMAIMACVINQFVWLGKLWDAYPHSYIIFYEDYWTTVRSGCISADNEWAYHMMDVIIKIVGGSLMICITCIPCCLCCMCTSGQSSSGSSLTIEDLHV